MGVLTAPKNEVPWMIAVSAIAKSAFEDESHLTTAMGVLGNAAARRYAQQCKLIALVACGQITDAQCAGNALPNQLPEVFINQSLQQPR